MSRQIIQYGLQEGDQLSIRTSVGERIQIVATKTRGGYVRLEIEMPYDTKGKLVRHRDIAQEENN